MEFDIGLHRIQRDPKHNTNKSLLEMPVHYRYVPKKQQDNDDLKENQSPNKNWGNEVAAPSTMAQQPPPQYVS